jgi:hypothetical protein
MEVMAIDGVDDLPKWKWLKIGANTYFHMSKLLHHHGQHILGKLQALQRNTQCSFTLMKVRIA